MTTVTLKKPVTHNDKTYSELTFEREAEFGDFIAAETFKGESAQTAAVLASLSGVPVQVIKKLVMSDVAAVLKVAGPLLGNGLETAPPTGGE